MECKINEWISIMCDLLRCSLVAKNWCYIGTCCINHHPDDGNRKFLSNICIYHLDYQHKHVKGDLFQHIWQRRWQTIWGVRLLQQTIFRLHADVITTTYSDTYMLYTTWTQCYTQKTLELRWSNDSQNHSYFKIKMHWKNLCDWKTFLKNMTTHKTKISIQNYSANKCTFY